MTSTHIFALNFLDPSSWVTSFVKALFHDALNAIGTAASNILSALIGFMNSTTEPIFSGGWWSSTGVNVFARVLAVAGALMFLGFAMSVVSAVLSHDHTVMTKAALHLPLAAIEMAALVTVTAALISGSDQIATYIAGGGSKGLTAFVTGSLVAAVLVCGLPGMLIAGFIIVAGLIVWAVLIVRTALIYVAVMTGPLIFASAIHPATRHARKRYIEGGIALICSKIVMAIAFTTGSAMLGGLSTSPSFADGIGALMQALAVLLIAAFAPFIFIKLLIAAEALSIAEGIERRPLRAATSGASSVYHAAGLRNLMNRSNGKGGDQQAGGGGGDGPDDGSEGGGGGGKPRKPSGSSGWRRTNIARGIAMARRIAEQHRANHAPSGSDEPQSTPNEPASSSEPDASPTSTPPSSGPEQRPPQPGRTANRRTTAASSSGSDWPTDASPSKGPGRDGATRPSREGAHAMNANNATRIKDASTSAPPTGGRSETTVQHAPSSRASSGTHEERSSTTRATSTQGRLNLDAKPMSNAPTATSSAARPAHPAPARTPGGGTVQPDAHDQPATVSDLAARRAQHHAMPTTTPLEGGS